MIKTLIVEDNAEFRGFLRKLVRERFPGGEVAECPDGRSALQLIGPFKPDIVLIDIALPGGMNGLALTERIREKGKLPPILIITSHALPEYQAAAARLGADHFLPKGCSTAKDILAVIERLVPGGSAAPAA